MPTVLQFRRGTSSQNDNFTGAASEITFDTTNAQLRVHDGSTSGGIKVLNATNPTTSGVLAHTGRATISTNLTISGNTSVVGLKANNSLGTSGQFLRSDGSRAYWDALPPSTQYLQVSNAAVTYQTISIERAALANTNSYIASVQSDVDSNEATERAALANTNSYIATKANIASPTFTGVPAAPTAAAATNTTQIATTAFVRTEVSNLVASAPSTLDTLNELAAALGDDPNFATTIASTYQTISTSKAYLANTNAYIATMLPKAGGQMTGNITFSGAQTVDGRDVSADGSKLDGIEAGATADQTAAEILTAIKTVDGAGSGLDADLLDGVSSASFLRSDASDSFTSGTLTVGGTALDVNVNMTAAGNITMDGSSKLLTLNNNSLDEFTEYARPLANSGTAITLDVSDNTQLYTLTGNCTFTLPALSNYPANSSKSITIVVKQDGTGGRTVAFSATDGYSINNSASVPAPSSGASKVSIYTCIGIVELAEWFISLSYIDD